MKLYRIKPELQKYFNSEATPMDLDAWCAFGVTIEALEEVEQRVKLVYAGNTSPEVHALSKYGGENITDKERELCEQALNGELFTDHQMKLYGVWKRKNPMGTVEKWLKQEA